MRAGEGAGQAGEAKNVGPHWKSTVGFLALRAEKIDEGRSGVGVWGADVCRRAWGADVCRRVAPRCRGQRPGEQPPPHTDGLGGLPPPPPQGVVGDPEEASSWA